MGKKRGRDERKPLASPSLSAAPVVVSEPAPLIPFLERRAGLLALAAVFLASVRIVATYDVFNHTYDEPAHIACGMEWLDKGVYTWETQHPPLSRVAAALGPYLLGVRSQNQTRGAVDSMLKEGTKILYAGHHYDRSLFLSRLGMLPFFWVASFVVYGWGRRYFDPAVAVLAVWVFTFVPAVLAHAGLSTTDMALTAFLGAAFLTGMMWLEEPRPGRAALFGLCGGLAIVSKFSCLVFFPVSVGVALLWYLVAERPAAADVLREIRERVATLAVAASVAFLVIWAVYRFSIGPVPFAHLKLPFPELYAGIQEVRQHNDRGHYTYLLGERRTTGWWYFFPVVFAVKTPLAFLIMLGFWVVLATRGQLGFKRSWIPMAFSGGIMAVGMLSSINIGLRHILPVYIGLSILVAVASHWILERLHQSRGRAGALSLLALWFAGSSLLSHPDYLPYFNELAGSHPEHIAVDSDLDWGQDIKRLAKRLQELGVQEVYLSTLLSADFEKEHGIPHRNDMMGVVKPPTGWVAIGFTYWKEVRLGLFSEYPEAVLWPDRIPPLEKVGKSMLLWYFPPASGTH